MFCEHLICYEFTCYETILSCLLMTYDLLLFKKIFKIFFFTSQYNLAEFCEVAYFVPEKDEVLRSFTDHEDMGLLYWEAMDRDDDICCLLLIFNSCGLY